MVRLWLFSCCTYLVRTQLLVFSFTKLDKLIYRCLLLPMNKCNRPKVLPHSVSDITRPTHPAVVVVKYPIIFKKNDVLPVDTQSKKWEIIIGVKRRNVVVLLELDEWDIWKIYLVDSAMVFVKALSHTKKLRLIKESSRSHTYVINKQYWEA